jgi:hypothetical protein
VDNNIVLIKPEAQSSIMKGICPFCHENHFTDEVLKVGYRKPKSDYYSKDPESRNWDISLEYLTISLPICEKCKEKYLLLCKFKLFARIGLDRSYCVLQRKLGYLRGLQFPFESWNIHKVDNS